MNNSRIETLDWLRGLTALSIMFYHITYWVVYPLDSSTALGRFGVYGVSIFFVLSGLSMAIVYNAFISSIKSSLNFFVRRLFRIWPLLWIAIILTIIPHLLMSETYGWSRLFLNFTTLFGFIEPSASIPTGAWSIGNEMVYYALTPIIFKLYNYKMWLGNLFFMMTLGVGLFFAFSVLDPSISLSDQWVDYVNPFNNLFLYVMGISIYYNFKDVNIQSNFNNLLLIVSLALFCFLPFEGNQITIVTGIGRIVFASLSFIIVFCFYKMKINLPSIFSNALETFGIATYGVYLIHPIVYMYLNYFLKRLNVDSSVLLYVLVSVFTVSLSIYSYKFIELKFIKFGKKVTSNSVKKLS